MMIRIDLDFKVECLEQQVKALQKDISHLKTVFKEYVDSAYESGYQFGMKKGIEYANREPDCPYLRDRRRG